MPCEEWMSRWFDSQLIRECFMVKSPTLGSRQCGNRVLSKLQWSRMGQNSGPLEEEKNMSKFWLDHINRHCYQWLRGTKNSVLLDKAKGLKLGGSVSGWFQSKGAKRNLLKVLGKCVSLVSNILKGERSPTFAIFQS